MKKIFVSMILLAGFAAHAEDAADKNHPCKTIKAACEAAGFKKGAHKEGKGLMKDCMAKIMNGEAVAGVTASPSDVEACKVKRAEHK